jgi:hypothetical protein
VTVVAPRELSIEASGENFRLYPDPQPIPPGRITETSAVAFHLRGPDLDIFKAELVVAGVPLDRVALAPDHIRWRWDIGFNAGVVDVELRGVGGPSRSFEVTTDPSVAKLTRDDYAQMVGDILADTVALISLAGHGVGIARGARLLELGRLHLMRRVFDRFEQAVVQIDRSPWFRIERGTNLVPIGQARRATPVELSRSLRSARAVTKEQAARLSDAGRRLAVTLGGRLPTRLSITTGRRDHRRREHADILMVILMWRSFLCRVGGIFASLRKADEDDYPQIEFWRRHVQNMLLRTARLQKLSLFDGVQPTRGPVTPSLLYRMVPSYKAFHRCYRDFMAGLAEIVGEFLRLPLRKTYDLYELWCFLRLARAAASRGGSVDAWKKVFAEVSAHGGLVRHLETRALDFGEFRLIYQPLYREIWRSGGPRIGSFSRQMQPDISISPSAMDKDRPLIVLDAKYRVEAGLNAAVSSIHMYRDALVERIGSQEDMANRRAVVAAFLLTPQMPGVDNKHWRETDTPQVFFRESYRESFRFGVITVRPGLTVDGARLLLDHLVALAAAAEPASASAST